MSPRPLPSIKVLFSSLAFEKQPMLAWNERAVPLSHVSYPEVAWKRNFCERSRGKQRNHCKYLTDPTVSLPCFLEETQEEW